MAELDARQQILNMLESGKISPEEAIQLLEALGEADEDAPALPTEAAPAAEAAAPAAPAEPVEPVEPVVSAAPYAAAPEPAAPSAAAEPEPAAAAAAEAPAAAEAAAAPEPEDLPREPASANKPNLGGFRNWWRYPLWAGVAVTILGAFFMYLAFRSGGYGFWFACAWFPFLFGVTMMALAWASRTARWLHVRVNQTPGKSPQRIAISLPLPLRLAAWVVQVFNIRTPEMDKKGLSEIILALEHTSPEAPFYVQVNDSEDGEHVEVYIG